jgi:hypothetical protein
LTLWAKALGHQVALATTFAGGRALLETAPDLLVAEVKLGEYNGLHLALRAQAAGVPAIVIGPADTVLEREAAALGALYFAAPVGRARIVDAMQQALDASTLPAPRIGSNLLVTTIAAEAEVMWRAFSRSPEPGAYAPGRTLLPN